MTSTIEAPTVADFKVGQRVAVEGYDYPGWNGPATVIDADGQYVSIKQDPGGEFASYEGAFEPKYIVPLPDSYSVHDVEGLEALPVDAIVRDALGTERRKLKNGRYSIDYAHKPEPEGYAGTSGWSIMFPAVLLNPEVLETPETTHGLQVGDRVRVIDASGSSRAVLHAEGDVVEVELACDNDDTNGDFVWVDQDGGERIGMYAYRFEKIEAQPALELDFEAEDPIKVEQPEVSHDGIAVGDKVRVTTTDFPWAAKFGEVYEVTKLDGIFIKVNTPADVAFPLLRSELEKVQPEIVVGSRVIVEEGAYLADIGMGRNLGATGTVISVDGYFKPNVGADVQGVHPYDVRMDHGGVVHATKVRLVEQPAQPESEDAGFGLATVHDDEGLDSLGNGSVIRLVSSGGTPVRVKIGGKWQRASQLSDAADHLTRLLVKDAGAEVLLAL